MYTGTIKAGGREYRIWSLAAWAAQEGIDLKSLPYSIKIMLENQIRHLEKNPSRGKKTLKALSAWNPQAKHQGNLDFYPYRVIMQDFTGVPAVADLAAMRDALKAAGGDGALVNPVIPVDLVIDHSVSVDAWGCPEAFKKNVDMEFHRNAERYRFLKWAQKSFDNLRVIPPGTGIIHQVNLEYLARGVFSFTGSDGILSACPDTLVGTDSHTTMINSLGVLGWGVGGIEAEAALLGLPLSIPIPQVVGVKLEGRLQEGVTATDLVLRLTSLLRETGVVGQMVEYFGPGLDYLSLEDRAAVSNMAPEYGATCGLFPFDKEVIRYLEFTGRSRETLELTEAYAREQCLWRDERWNPGFSRTLTLDLGTVVQALAGPGRPQDLVALPALEKNFRLGLKNYSRADLSAGAVPVEGKDFSLSHGDVVIAALTSCTNTSSPLLMIAAGLAAKKAVTLGLKTKPWVKASLAPGSRVVMSYLEKAGLVPFLEKLGFYLTGYGCTTCIGNSGPLDPAVSRTIRENNLVTVNVLSGNRNFEGRIHPDVRAGYLASPPLVVAFALAGTVLIDLPGQALGTGKNGKPVFLKDILPSDAEVRKVREEWLKPEMFRQTYGSVFAGTENWQALPEFSSVYYPWEESSSYLRRPPFFGDHPATSPGGVKNPIKGARCLAILPDSTTTDHISPAGNIKPQSPAGLYLEAAGVSRNEFNSYGSRRGNHEVMIRGTFGNIRLKNRMVPAAEGGFTLSYRKEITDIFTAAEEYRTMNIPLLVFAGREYGTGSSRDWAAKGTLLLGVRGVIAQSFERIHRSNLAGMGVLPLEFDPGESAEFLGLDGTETFDLSGWEDFEPGSRVKLTIHTQGRPERTANLTLRIDSEAEQAIFRAGGILPWVLEGLKKEGEYCAERGAGSQSGIAQNEPGHLHLGQRERNRPGKRTGGD